MDPSSSSSGSFAPPSDGSLPTHIGTYRVLRRLATGGTSDVLLARVAGTNGVERAVVLKLLLQQYRDDQSFERMFTHEAAAYARLSHPAIVKLFDFFSDAGQLVMVLEYVDGLPLHKLRALLRPQRTPFDDQAAMYIAWRVFGALAAAHTAHDPRTGELSPVIHRDVNPSNILIPWDGEVKIADFGIAKVAGMDNDKTQAGFIKGTYGYMAPEQVRGEELTVRADVYAGCLLLWELLAGRKAIVRGSTTDLEVLRAMAEPTFPALSALRPDLPLTLLDAVERGLQPDPAQRDISAEELTNALRLSFTLDDGRQRLVHALAGVRPVSTVDDLAPTVSRAPSFRPADSSADATIPNPVTLRGTPSDSPEAQPRTAPPEATRKAGRTTVAFGDDKLLPAVRTSPPTAPPRPASTTSTLKMGSQAPSAAPPPQAPSGAPPPQASSAAPPPQTTTSAPPVQASRTPPPQARTPAPPPVLTTTLAMPAPITVPLPPVRPQTPPPPPPAPLQPFAPPPAPVFTPVPPAPSQVPTVPPTGAAPALVAWTPSSRTEETVRRRTNRTPVVALSILIGVAACAGIGMVVWSRTRAPVTTQPDETPMPTTATDSTPTPTVNATATQTATATPPPTATVTATTAAPTATATATTAAPTATSAPSTTPSADPVSLTGTVTVSPEHGGHRVWVDKHIVGESPGTFSARCGWHTVQVGSQGTPHNVQIPCGGDLEIR